MEFPQDNKPYFRPEDRAEKGLFKKGCKAGPGNPFAREVAQFRAELYRSVREGDVAAVADKVKDQALKGCVKSQRLFFDILGIVIKQIDAKIETNVSPDEARQIVNEFFGIK
jgi:hypothetical protein